MKIAKIGGVFLGVLLIVGCAPGKVRDNGSAIEYSEQVSITNRVGNLSVSVMLVNPQRDLGSDHIEVWVHGLAVGRLNQKYILLLSPDLGVRRKEELVWSDDERYALLICENVDGTLESRFPDTKRHAYALFDTRFMRVWCNATQLNLERFSFSDLERLGFESLIKK